MIDTESRTAVKNGLCSLPVNILLGRAGYPIDGEDSCYRTVYTAYSDHDWREVAPHADAMRWLRNVHHISIDVVTCWERRESGSAVFSDEVTGYSFIVHLTDYHQIGDDQRCVTHLIEKDDVTEYETFEECCNEALRWVLTHLI